jgi:hypothetical protein
MKSTKEIAEFQRSVEGGILNTTELRRLWRGLYAQNGNRRDMVGDFLGHPIVYCDACGQPAFAAKTKSAYAGARWFCETCSNKYAYCDSCRSYVMVEDLNNPTHRHENLAKDANPGILAFDAELGLAPYNADIVDNGGLFHKTPSEIELLIRRKKYATNPERVFRNFGVELEVEKLSGGPPDILSRTRNLLGKFALVKRDGSLSRDGQGGFEIVSCPATLAYHKGGAWTPFFQHLGSFFQESPSTTGLHIHVGLNTLSPLVVNKMILFVNAQENREFIFGIANRNLQRKNPNGRVYAGVKDWTKSDMMRLKQHTGSCLWHPQNREKGNFFKVLNGQIQYDPFGLPILAKTKADPVIVRPVCKCEPGHYNVEHYEAVNLRTHRPTVELRMFRGVVNESFLYSCLEFADSLADFCAETVSEELHYKDYLLFLEDKTKRYSNLYRLLVNQCWIDPPKDKRKTETLTKVPAYGIYA